MDSKPRTNEKIKEMLNRPVDPVYRELAAKLQTPNSEIMPRVLERLMTLQQATILNSLPATPAEIAEKLKISQEIVDKEMQEMFEKGILFPGRSGWHMTRSWGALHDSTGSSDTKFLSDEFIDLAFVEHEEQIQGGIDKVLSGEEKTYRTGMRVVPRWRSIKDIPDILPIEDVRQILKSVDKIAVVDCACRKIDRNRECKNTVPLKTCLTLGRSAEYNLNRGAGKELSYEEAMELIDSFDKYNLVHLTGNRNTMPILMCNCHYCCCGVFHRHQMVKEQLDQRVIVKSRFMAEVDPEKCRVCQTCVSACPIGAVEMKFYPEYGEERSYTNADECIGCGCCVISCPAEARQMKLVRPPEHIPSPDAQFTADGT